MLHTFYQSVVASAIFFAVVSWGSDIKAKDTNTVNKLIEQCCKVIGSKLVILEEVVEKRQLAKLLAIMNNPSHPLHDVTEG